ncbi:1875_t:CDS:1, partial [Dentiscutata erythropus]
MLDQMLDHCQDYHKKRCRNADAPRIAYKRLGTPIFAGKRQSSNF